ncbi:MULTISPECIES: serine hydroxymethyltransferase [Streptomycetaceae]|uniref:Serine hydroxymethyltransferase n=1 Tax=Streptantibioticus cattleyicolor (strain ATCC 35852 / DSM 46488 / JCM 4925 / NBRC 14057 / NRRL 8057) TaxID=1003195 RepID=F8JQ82_STREN|nr:MULTISPECIES: serine hydroxymethyltransferase [Streptomycetaceae]AEW96545.1 serine hydroxymethyltransferase [Streptantibioticus cattleyicolor NRRL 8057 = DSM 46488]MYS61044.1 serine hydroxymethyltransferase [Streptomyces sp. SID5468]CCB76882.1 serine hydroxymethyltransferase [Streptantibioticus cattleyicolor NRRL 8057 = DSM 46488]
MTVAGTSPHASTRATPWTAGAEALRRQDPELAGVLLAEYERQTSRLQLVAAENFASPAVLAALGSPLANKYAEGYPGQRHHGGCELVDMAERLAVERACALFGAEHANVQPYSGSAAVLAAYAALLVPGDTVLAMALPHGGHLTHGSPANFSGRWFDFAGYGVREDTGLIDYDEVRELARNRRPKAIVAGAIAYPRHIDYAAFREIADEVDAYLIVDAAHTLGLVAGGAAPSPVPYADVVCATTHKTLRGPRGGLVLCGRRLARRIDRAVFPFTQGGPQMHTIAATAVALGEAATPAFRGYARQVVANARALAAALAAQGAPPQTGGTDTHLITADVTPLGVGGPAARGRCAAARIVLDKCPLPKDAPAPRDCSGIRLGTAAVTTQGMREPEMARIGDLLGRALRGDASAGGEVAELVAGFPPYRDEVPPFREM